MRLSQLPALRTFLQSYVPDIFDSVAANSNPSISTFTSNFKPSGSVSSPSNSSNNGEGKQQSFQTELQTYFQHTSHKILDLSCAFETRENVQQFFSAFPPLPLEQLILDFITWQRDELSILIRALMPSAPSLTHISLQHCELDAALIENLKPLLTPPFCLEHFDLSNNEALNSSHSNRFVDVVTENPSILMLKLNTKRTSYHRTYEENQLLRELEVVILFFLFILFILFILLHLLLLFSSLQLITIQNNKGLSGRRILQRVLVSPAGVKKISNWKQLLFNDVHSITEYRHTLKLSHKLSYSTSTESLQMICEAMSMRVLPFQEIDLSHNNLTDPCCLQLYSTFKKYTADPGTKLKLTMSDNQLTDVGKKMLLLLASQTSSDTQIDLDILKDSHNKQRLQIMR